jgi:3-oxoacid CoA-transferase A subunit
VAINKVVESFDEAVKDVFDGSVILVGGFVGLYTAGGTPTYLIQALVRQGANGLTVVSNSTLYTGDLCKNKQIKKGITAFPVLATSQRILPFEEQCRAGQVKVEIVPQGTLAERIRANRAGIGAFYTPVGAGTIVERGKEVRIIDGKPHLLEYPIKADFAFIRAYKADRLGNLIYRGTSRTFNATMAGAAKITIAEVDEIVPVGELDPEAIVTPGIYVERVVVRPEEGRTNLVQKIGKGDR